MRHQHAGLSIRDFPLAYGKLWPATDAASVAQYNAQRVEITNFNPITAFQIELQMVHRIVAMLILCAVAFCAWQAWRKFSGPVAKLSVVLVCVDSLQAGLGAATVLSDKAADIATAPRAGRCTFASHGRDVEYNRRSISATCCRRLAGRSRFKTAVHGKFEWRYGCRSCRQDAGSTLVNESNRRIIE